MKKIITITSIALLLAACGGTTIIKEVAPTTTEVVETTVEQTVPPTTEVKLAPDQQFISDLMLEYSWIVNKMGRVNLVKLGETICAAIDEGMSFTQYLDMLIKQDIDMGAGGALLRESIENFCPKEQWFLDAAIDELSRG